MNRLLRIALCLAFAVTLAHTSFAQVTAPQGRLTLVTGQPILQSDQTDIGTIYYTAYIGNQVPIYNPSTGTFTSYYFTSDLVLTLESTYQAVDTIYDIYAYVDSSSNLNIGINAASWPGQNGRCCTLSMYALDGHLA